jgi:hypothetical protein
MRYPRKLLEEMSCHQRSVSVTLSTLKRLHRMESMKLIKCTKLEFPEGEDGIENDEEIEDRDSPWSRVRRIPRMECHDMALVMDRFAVVFGGWGPRFTNHCYAIDLQAFKRCHFQGQVPLVECSTLYIPRFRYGFTVCTTTASDKVLLYGGFRQGGYSGDSNELFQVDFSVKLTVESRGGEEVMMTAAQALSDKDSFLNSHVSSLQASYSIAPQHHLSTSPAERGCPFRAAGVANTTRASGTVVPTPRGFHSAIIVHINGEECMLVWGGLHNGGCLQALEAFNVEQKRWNRISSSGAHLSRRFGHSCIFQASHRRLVFTGGSDGSDLLRNGSELCDIGVLTIVNDGSGDQFLWSSPTISLNYIRESMDIDIMGRCHEASLVSDKILLFGGGAVNTNSLAVVSLFGLNSTPSLINVFKPHVSAVQMPFPRCAGASLKYGHHLFIFGGWSNEHDEIGDIFMLDLGASKL